MLAKRVIRFQFSKQNRMCLCSVVQMPPANRKAKQMLIVYRKRKTNFHQVKMKIQGPICHGTLSCNTVYSADGQELLINALTVHVHTVQSVGEEQSGQFHPVLFPCSFITLGREMLWYDSMLLW